ncbi:MULTISPECIES: hypothetical protein [unclassified Crossiella]|uniref:hypothetical protein n=1 Tax=unclassified Crossiella TaxID=2620835 RepID=UPI001FFF8B21|nr:MULTISPECIES: hypothetical protein [unclassified Crossiella]MCK2241723.1 hypothetical protein [Crossiella sp. S99.2]MCK2255405.1 hypothetical protein [Crossiella sp. S99.1]
MVNTARRLRVVVVGCLAAGVVLLVLTLVLVLTDSGPVAILPGLIGFVFLLVGVLVGWTAPARSRPARALAPGVVRQFRNQRHYFTTLILAMAGLFGIAGGAVFALAGPWAGGLFAGGALLGRLAFIIWVPPKGGWRGYQVSAEQLIIRTPEDQLAIPWPAIGHLMHRPVATSQGFGTMTTYHDYIEVHLAAPAEGFLVIHGVRRQAALSRLIIDQCREPVLRALRARFEHDGEVAYGQFRFARDGVHAPDGFLPWGTDWQARRFFHEDGVRLTVYGPKGAGINGWVPVEMIALDLLNAVASPPRG